jgi:hypothetical protein
MIDVNLPYIEIVQKNFKTIAMSYGYAIAEDYIPTHSQRKQLGFNSATTTTLRDVGEMGVDIIPLPTTALQISITGNAADTAAGAGAQLIEIHGLDANWNEVNEIITMNGIAAVTTVNNYIRINGAHVVRAGANGVATGPILISNGATEYYRIGTGSNTSQQALFTIPQGKIGYITSWSGGATGKETRLILRLTCDHYKSLLLPVFITHGIMVSSSGTTIRHFNIPIKCPAKCDIKISANTTLAGGTASAEFRLWLEDEEL